LRVIELPGDPLSAGVQYLQVFAGFFAAQS
jgi:hypothetical protein